MNHSQDGLRQRHKKKSIIKSAISSTSQKFQSLSLKTKCLFVLLAFTLLVAYIIMLWYQVTNRLREFTYIQADTCPACYGSSICLALFRGDAHFTGMLSKIRSFDYLNSKNFHYGKLNGKEVVLKKLVADDVLKDLDDKICRSARRTPGCDVARVVVKADFVSQVRQHELEVDHLKGVNDMFYCPSRRLLDRLLKYYLEKYSYEAPYFYAVDKIQILITAMISSEPLMLQTFPASQGWPFPSYIGACGRFVLLENCGESLQNFHQASLKKRYDLAYQVMKIANFLAENPSNFSLYWTSLKPSDFVVDQNGHVKFVDLKNIIVVDKEEYKEVANTGKPKTFEAIFTECENFCPPTPTNELCNHLSSDWNIYLACRHVLSEHATDPAMKGGLLHDMSHAALDDWDMRFLIKECTSPTTKGGRIKSIHRLLHTLDSLRNGKEQHPVNI
ncbi:divergent protein kinase domain 2A [Octopus bimaculoides]|uniref:FAM69 protein-kinase domain-containing protein n=1 Tax=Octopus bimaculoides TaxID=37653 RepID=A0A0L8H3P2_OCTBM|nr:divergent protein kinase domain 2A [Octopus bimaculoides]XP_014775795.1 divergent protein kinase domain 2A [Octopus bimaculoides]XP_014775796.1 divergent protein kinase domain 2A [Octopus bimaculoides]XP_014775797.1 divergent protein kinase domain 2A [Octopus bimaculoides]XP_052830589.1 divergent protein kinase domain 2A [Octopus bimaculoides]|eukprot:XP_014775794.1 PREDICTED: deleted in autism protein 1 homolog [Octopus bimaculoides]